MQIITYFISRADKIISVLCNQCYKRRGRQKSNTIRRNCKVGDDILLKEAAAEQHSWKMENIVPTNNDKNVFVRSVKLILGTSGKTDMVLHYLKQPVNKLAMLVENK